MEKEQLGDKIINILKSNNVPQEIKTEIKRIYLDYEDAYKTCLARMQRAEGLRKTDISKSIEEAFYEYHKNDIIELEKLMQQGYEQKKKKTENDVMDYINGERLEPVIFNSKEDEENYNKNKDKVELDSIIENRQRNEEFIIEMQTAMLEKINNAKKELINKYKSNRTLAQNDEQVLYDRYIENKAIEEMHAVQRKVLEEFPEVGKILEKQDNKIYNEIINEIEEFKSKEDRPTNAREEFMASMHVEVEIQEAVKKVLEESKQEEKNTKSLPDNVIE